MIFGDQLLPKVLDGSKVVTRRPVKREDLPGRWRNRTCKYEVGKTYAVQPVIKHGPGKGRGGKAVGRIRILHVRRGLVAGVDANEARLEGFKTAGEFRRHWTFLYGSYDPTQLVDRIEFELLEEA